MSLGRHPRADVDGDAADLPVHLLALPCVEPGADLDPQLGNCAHDLMRAADRPRRPVEGREEAVPGSFDLDSPTLSQQPPNQRVVLLEEIVPTSVSELRRRRRRPDDVREQDRGQDAVAMRRLAGRRECVQERVSRASESATGSDMPVPRLSN